MSTTLAVDRRRLSALCRRWKVRELYLFGSMADGTAGPRSDVDLMVTFLPRHGWSLLDLAQMQLDLQDLFGREVDLMTGSEIRNPFVRKTVLANRKRLYARQGA